MKTSLLSLFAGTVFLAGSAIAGAAEPVALSPAQMDQVTAGTLIPKAAYAEANASAFAKGKNYAETYTNTKTKAIVGYKVIAYSKSNSASLAF